MERRIAVYLMPTVSDLSASGQWYGLQYTNLLVFNKNNFEKQQAQGGILRSITMYSTQWCGDCKNAKRVLRERNISYQEINIDQNEAAARQVIEWSGGRRVIPTIVIDEQSTGSRVILHNPPVNTLVREIEKFHNN